MSDFYNLLFINSIAVNLDKSYYRHFSNSLIYVNILLNIILKFKKIIKGVLININKIK